MSVAPGGPDPVVWMAGHRQELIEDLTTLVEHETPSDDLDLLRAGAAHLDGWLRSRIGTPLLAKIYRGGEFGDCFCYEWLSPRGSSRWVTALCHYDTVWPSGTLADWPVTIDGDRVSGPGAFDMKAGIVQFAWAVACCDRLGLPRPNVRLILNGDEELGSPVSRPVIEASVSATEPVLVFEASAGGALKTARKGVGIFGLEAHGVEAHAGLDPAAGVSAIDEIARAIVSLHGAADPGRGTTVNVGTVRGGTRANVTAGEASISVDIRISSRDEAARIDRVLASLRPRQSRASFRVAGAWNRPVMERTTATAALFARAQAVAATMGLELRETSVGGASDGNFAAALGAPVLDGLGAFGDGAHARSEWVSIDGMLERASLVAALLADLARAVTTS